MKYVNKFFKGFGNMLDHMNKRQMGVQSNLFWLIAFFNLSTDKFWMFAIPAIVFRGLQIVIDELRKEA
jgi:hypothetical protein